MGNTMTANALRLKEYIGTIDDFQLIEPDLCPYHNHIGALLTDAILQAGVNYQNIVYPRVEYILAHFPDAYTISTFARVLSVYGTANVLSWKNREKLRRMDDLVNFCYHNSIETTDDLIQFMKEETNVSRLKKINGIGNKTCDYIKRLLGFDTVAVDRHICHFLDEAEIVYHNYYEIKKVVEFAADFMDCSRRELDYSIWKYMTNKKRYAIQLSFDF